MREPGTASGSRRRPADRRALAAALDAVSDGVVLIDRDGAVVHANAVARTAGVASDVGSGGWAPITTTGLPYPQQARPGLVALRTGRPVRAVEMGVRDPDDEIHWLEMDAFPVAFDADGRCERVAVSFREVTRERAQRVELEARVTTERLLASLSHELAQATAETLAAQLDGALRELCTHLDVQRARVGQVSGDTTTLDCLAHWCAPGCAPPRQWLEPIALADVPLAHTLLANGSVITADIAELPTAMWREAERLASGATATMLIAPLAIEGEILGALALERDHPTPWAERQRGMVEQLAAVLAATIARVRAERRLAYEATHDQLTGLPQRKLVLEQLERAIVARDPYAPDGASTAVLFIDLDHFKRVNDSLGHASGDQLLVAFAERLTRGVRGCDLAGRLGGDEFVVVCPGVRSEDEARAIGRRLLALVEAPFTIEGVEVFVGASIGIALADADVDAPTLLRQADTAAYRAKDTGRNHCVVFDDELRAVVEHRLATETALRHALDRGELLLHYQPIVLTDDASICAFEALARWNRPGAGIVAPENFLAIAEESGLIVPLGLDVFRQGCAQAAAWQDRFGHDAPMVCINLSVLQLVQADFLASIHAILTETGVDPSQICLEITESSIMRDPDLTIALLEELRTLGLALAIDDFGTGYSSLSHLRQLPVDVLKIDRSFVLEIGVDHEGATIVASIVALAHALGMTIVAEGVETVEHVAVLHNLGCDRMQGFYFSAALPAEEATRVVERGRLPGPHAASA